MKKRTSKLMALVMALGAVFSTTACGVNVIEEVDDSKVQLYIASYSGGGGYKWLDAAVERFETRYAGTTFGDKEGVQVIVEHSKNFAVGKTESTFLTGTYDLLFSGDDYNAVAQSGSLMDITDVMTSVSPYDGKTIESKLTSEKQSVLKIEGKYYGIPYFDFYPGISYDADLFREQQFYFSDQLDAADTTYPGTNAFITTKAATNLSCGPDAVFGTEDDGLPSSYQEFYKLMDRMIQRGVKPFAFTGVSTHYTNYLMQALAANYIGADGWKTNFNFNSNGTKVEVVTGFNGNTPQTESVELTEENAYLIKQSLGVYYASEFAQKVFSNTQYYDVTSASQSSTNLATQERFMRSGLDQDSPEYIGMLIEGSYWYNEAESEGVFERARKLDENNQIKNIKFMSLPHQYEGTVTPKAEGETPVSQVLVNVSNSYAFMSANTPSERVEVAKLFLQFCYSDDELVKAELANNGIARGLNYDSSSIEDELPTYAKSLNVMKSQALSNGTVFDSVSRHPIYLSYSDYFSTTSTSKYWSTEASGTTYLDVYKAYHDGKCTLKDYFKGLELKKADWEAAYLPLTNG